MTRVGDLRLALHERGSAPESDADRRELLADLLNEAAELEHSAMCMYLFAGFSLKKTVAEGAVSFRQLELVRQWHARLMMIARQEMEHLGIVCNLLTAIGEAPRLRPRVGSVRSVADPGSRHLSGPFDLEPFGPAQLLRFICIEMPADLDAADRRLLESAIPDFDPGRFDGVVRLYDRISSLFQQIDPVVLFVGPRSAQTQTSDVFPAKIRGIVGSAPAYNVVLNQIDDAKTAVSEIARIVSEGEGAPATSAECHFAWFIDIYRQLNDELALDPDFAPARPVVTNPSLHAASGATSVTEPVSVALMELFDRSFTVVVALLSRFFMHTDENADESAALQRTAFFPMMTTVIRPLAEMLTELPANADGEGRAGPSFDLPVREAFLPHKQAAWRVLHTQLAGLRDHADLVRRRPDLSPAMQDRLELMWENLHRVAADFALRMDVDTRGGA